MTSKRHCTSWGITCLEPDDTRCGYPKTLDGERIKRECAGEDKRRMNERSDREIAEAIEGEEISVTPSRGGERRNGV
ncbi:hypothetical protein CRG98_041693 [Punica granatum]|uniref:Uncharacterized protein n=1 Tax=Punica granatum TaxID=22663 RepID=A0A2I0I1S8_PUNGR|nr:hypothetical protein CRG98_041693 [Punica granatum]